MEFEEKSKLEALAGNLTTTIIASAVGAFAGGIPGAILPVLTNSFAHQRHVARVEKAINDILLTLDNHKEQLETLTDPQYKIISESISCVHKCVDDKKIEYLKKAIANTFSSVNLEHGETDKISGIIRNITANEAKFLVEKKLNGKPFKRVTILHNSPPPKSEYHPDKKIATLSITLVNPDDYVKDDSLNIRENSQTNQMVYDLQVLGLLRNSGSNDKGTVYRFTPIAGKVTTLLK